MAQPRVEHKGSAVAVAGSSGSASPVIDTQIRIGRGQISNRPTAEQFIEEFANVIDLVAANCPTSDLVERVDQLIRWIRQDRDWRHSGFDNVTLGQMEIKLREVKDGLQQSLKGETITFDRPLDDLRSLLRVLTRENGAQRKTSSAASDAREKDATTSPASLPSPNIFRRSGEFWDITFEDKTIHLQDCSGARYIHKLLEHPREALKATDLECGEEAQVREEYSGEEILDVAGKKKIEAALSDLRERSEKAKKENDIGTQENLEEQIDALQKEVKRSHGLGRYQRRLGDPNEMARSRVGHAIQATLKRVKKDHPVLHEHFKKAILRPSGKQPCYMPDPVVLWLLR